MKYFLTIAASDNSGGAGVQQDIKVAWDLGYWPLSAITGLTVQNFRKAQIIRPVESELVYEQVKESLSLFDVKAVKIGALTSEDNVSVVVRALTEYKPQIVVLDPVVATSSGKKFLSDRATELMIRDLLPLVSVVTPNAVELGIISGREIKDFDEAKLVAAELSNRWNAAIIVKGGHLAGKTIKEAVVQQGQIVVFEHERLDLSHYSHGTGCTFSSALACYLGGGFDLIESYRLSTEYFLRFYKRMQEECGDYD